MADRLLSINNDLTGKLETRELGPPSAYEVSHSTVVREGAAGFLLNFHLLGTTPHGRPELRNRCGQPRSAQRRCYGADKSRQPSSA